MRIGLAVAVLSLAALGCSEISGAGEFRIGGGAVTTGAGGGGGSGGAEGGAGGAGGSGGNPVVGCGLPFVDDFDTAANPALRWQELQLDNGTGYLEQTGGFLNLGVGALMAPRGITVWTRDNFDLRGCAVHIQLVQPLSVTGSVLAFSVGEPGNLDFAGFQLQESELLLDNDVQRIAYEPDSPIWLRIREADGDVALDTSADGRGWNEVYRSTPSFSLDTVELRLATYSYAYAQSGAAVWDNLNAPP